MSVPQESIGDILSGKDPAPVVETKGETAAPPAAETKSEPETKAEKPTPARDETGKFAKAEKPDEPAKTPPNVAGIIDERRKRQALEKQLAELQAQKPQMKPSIFDNEDEAIRTRVDEATRPLREAHYNLSMRYARQIHGDSFADAEAAFLEAGEADPRLYEGLRQAADPGEYVYIHGNFHKEMAEVGGDILKYREKVTADSATRLKAIETENAALKAEVEALKKSKTELEQIPTSLNGRASSAPANGEVGHESLSQLVRFGKPSR